jgi:hypothetical protein
MGRAVEKTNWTGNLPDCFERLRLKKRTPDVLNAGEDGCFGEPRLVGGGRS